MSTSPPLDPSEPEPEPQPQLQLETESPPARAGWTLVALIADDGQEPAASLSESAALGCWCAISALWHPSLLARAAELPRVECVDYPSAPGPNQIRVLAEGTAGRLPSGYDTQIEDSGAILIEGGTDREALVRALQEKMGLDEGPEAESVPGNADAAAAARDYLALGTARWWLRDLTIAMNHADVLDEESLTREVFAGAGVWLAGDCAAATNRLRAAFELLTQARERFYSVDAYLIDVCLIDPNMPGGVLQDALEARTPVTFLAPGHAIDNQAARDPERIAALRAAISEGWADVAGGAYDEVDEPLAPIESILWQFRRGSESYRKHLDDRNVETLARRRFALYPQLPQIAKRFGFRFGVHLGFDAGRFPIRSESKRLWESPDGSNIEVLTRPPLGADRALAGLSLPWRLGASMKDDHVATIGLVHWPEPVAPWYLDFRRVAAYSPVLARWVTLNDYFHLTDRPFESFRPESDSYISPYLAQASARLDPEPISRRAAHARLRARFEALNAGRALAHALLPAEALPVATADDLAPSALEEAIETGRGQPAQAALARQEPAWAAALARAILGSSTEAGRPGYFVFNSLGLPRRAAVLLPEAAADLRPAGPLRAAQFTAEGVWAVVDLPALGYAWIPRETDPSAAPVKSGAVSARDRVLRNEALEVEIDPATGGIRSVRAPREPSARLAQQLVISGPSGPSKMRVTGFEVEYAGPALVQAVSRGDLIDPQGDRRLASFQQTYRLWTGRPILELEIALSDLDPAWLEECAGGDPWSRFLSCRWAWPDPSSMLRRTCLLAPELTEVDRPETPDAIDISTRRQRTALLFGGLAYHVKHGPRMLDTLLIAGKESARAFTLGVVLDQEHPFHAALDLVTPPLVAPTESGPPGTGPSGWLVQCDHKAVAITHLEYAETSGDGRGWGLVFHLVETAGRAARCRLRLFRNPVWARQTDFNHEPMIDLALDSDAVLVDLTPHEIARLDVTLG